MRSFLILFSDFPVRLVLYAILAYPSLLLFCSLLALIAALRELDHYSEVMLFRGAYKYPGGAIGALALYHLGKDRQKLRKEISAFIKEPAFFFLAFGFFLAAILAQILGPS